MTAPMYRESRRCPKCGGYASTRWSSRVFGVQWAPSLIRVCGRCGYWWHERPLDDAPTAGSAGSERRV